MSEFPCSDPYCPICNPVRESPSIRTQEYKPASPPKHPWRQVSRLKLVGSDNQPAVGVAYAVQLRNHINSVMAHGYTDECGLTNVLTSDEERWLASLDLQPPESCRYIGVCCSPMFGENVFMVLTSRRLEALRGRPNATTRVTDSIATIVVPEGKKRRMTPGEVAMARTVYGDGVDYEKVWIHHGGWWMFMGMQRGNTAVTPNGEMYYPKMIYQEDFSDALKPNGQALFMHEMAHVWQYQMGYPVKRRGLTVTSRGSSVYEYTLRNDSRLKDFNMEQHAEILSNYYMACVIKDEQYLFSSRDKVDLLQRVVKPFIGDQRNKIHLPD